MLVTGNMLSHLDEVKTVSALPDDPLLPQEETLVRPEEEEEEEGSPPAAQLGPKRGPGRGRRAKGRRPGATAAAKNKGENEQVRVNSLEISRKTCLTSWLETAVKVLSTINIRICVGP